MVPGVTPVPGHDLTDRDHCRRMRKLPSGVVVLLDQGELCSGLDAVGVAGVGGS